ncbi:MAG: HAD domain-containing protein [Bacteroidota bacterium]
MNAILFLDIDGVANSRSFIKKNWPKDSSNFRSWTAMIDPEKAERINRIVSETGASIVICSDWRHEGTPEEVFEVLTTGGIKGPFIGVTPAVGEGDRRDIEVIQWIRENIGTDETVISEMRFIAVDDNPQMYPMIRGRVIQTSFETGITEGNTRAAIKMLKTPVGHKTAKIICHQA